ncbi:MAG: hypothetical protein LBD08_00830, partial [Treponema sp.]|nr:hypothetical protein [Treponema sp.]
AAAALRPEPEEQGLCADGTGGRQPAIVKRRHDRIDRDFMRKKIKKSLDKPNILRYPVNKD